MTVTTLFTFVIWAKEHLEEYFRLGLFIMFIRKNCNLYYKLKFCNCYNIANVIYANF